MTCSRNMAGLARRPGTSSPQLETCLSLKWANRGDGMSISRRAADGAQSVRIDLTLRASGRRPRFAGGNDGAPPVVTDETVPHDQ